MMKRQIALSKLMALLSLSIPFVLCAETRAHEWMQFRGLNGSGISKTTNLPVEFSPTKNVVWKTPLPGGHSSPVLGTDRIFLTAVENNRLYTIGLERQSGKLLWKREVPRPRTDPLQKP